MTEGVVRYFLAITESVSPSSTRCMRQVTRISSGIAATPCKNGSFDIARPCIVSCHGQQPISKLLIKIFEVPGWRAGGLFRIRTFVNPPVLSQTIFPTSRSSKLPEPFTFRFGVSQRLEPAFGLTKINEVLRQYFFCQNLGNHGPI